MKPWMATAVLSLTLLGACGPSQELVQTQADMETLRKENARLKTKVSEMEGQLKRVGQERDQLKLLAAKPPPAPAPVAAPTPSKKNSTTARK